MHILGFLAACYLAGRHSPWICIFLYFTFMMHSSHLAGHGTCIRSMMTPWFFFCKTNVLRTTPLNPKGQSQCKNLISEFFFIFFFFFFFLKRLFCLPTFMFDGCQFFNPSLFTQFFSVALCCRGFITEDLQRICWILVFTVKVLVPCAFVNTVVL